MIDESIPALREARLKYVARHYIRPETLIAANARIVDHHARLELATRWGGGEVASTDSPYDIGDHTVQQSADLFSVPRTTVYGHLDDASKGKRPAIHRKPNSPADASAG